MTVLALFVFAAIFGSGDDRSSGAAGGSSYTTDVADYRATLADSIEIVDWNWMKDPDFGTEGAVKWNVQLKNNSTRYVEQVRVEFTSYDAAEKLIATTFTYVSAIPPGGTRSEEAFADYYGTESGATVQVVTAYPAQR